MLCVHYRCYIVLTLSPLHSESLFGSSGIAGSIIAPLIRFSLSLCKLSRDLSIPRPSSLVGICPLKVQMLVSLRARARRGCHSHRLYTSFSDAITGTITSVNSQTTAKRPGKAVELLVFTRATLIVDFANGLEEGLVDTMVLDGAVMDVKTKSAPVLTVVTVLPTV